MEEVSEREAYQASKAASAAPTSQQSQGRGEFRVRDAPWSHDESLFPSLASAAGNQPKAPQGPWGRR